MGGTLRRLVAAMAREEWRLHARLFGGWRFAAFPLVLAVGALGTVWALERAGTPVADALVALHGLALLLGLHTGSIGFAGRDAMRNLLGEATLLLFSGRTLPLSRRRLLAAFVLKDVGYYAVLFLVPVAVGFAPAVGVAGAALLLASLGATFVLGLAVTLSGIALWTRGVPGPAVGAGLGAAAVSGWLWADFGGHLRALATDPVSGAGAGVAVVAGALLAAGLLGYDPAFERPARTARERYAAWREWLPVRDPLLVRTLLELARSSGGVWKVGVSALVLLAASTLLAGAAEVVAGVRPSPPIFFGGVLALSAFTTYNWLTAFDGPEHYRALPVSLSALLRAKRRAFLLVGVPTAVGSYALALAWYGAGPAAAAAGLVLLVGFGQYLLGLTAYLAGLDPGEFLFDTALFATFGAGLAVPLVPVLVAGFVDPAPPALLAGVAGAGAGLAVVGEGCFRRAAPRWERHYRRGTG